MSLVIALSSVSQLAVGWSDAGGLHGRLPPLLVGGAIGPEIRGSVLVLSAQDRQMRLQVIVAGSLPLALAGKGGDRFLAGVEQIRDETLVLNLLLAVAGLDPIVIRLREFGILEREVSIAQKRLPRAGRAIVGTDFVDLEQDRNKAEQRHGRLRHLRQRPEFLPPESARLRHQHHSAATICAGSRMPASSISALCEYSSMRASISWRKCAIRPWIGQAAASPSAQMVWPSTCFVTSSSMSISRLWARPSAMRVKTRHIHPVPSRHGVHWPQLSCL